MQPAYCYIWRNRLIDLQRNGIHADAVFSVAPHWDAVAQVDEAKLAILDKEEARRRGNGFARIAVDATLTPLTLVEFQRAGRIDPQHRGGFDVVVSGFALSGSRLSDWRFALRKIEASEFASIEIERNGQWKIIATTR